MFKNTAGQKITLLVIDIATNAPKTGDAANLTAYVSQDDGAVTALTDTSATELDATNAPGLYVFDVSQTESNADKLVFSGKSSTSNVRVRPETIYTRPSGFASLAIANNAVAANVTRYNGTAGTFNSGRPEVTILTSDKTGFDLSSSGRQAIWDVMTGSQLMAGAMGKLLVDNVNTTISSRLASSSYTAPLDAAGVRSAIGLTSANLNTQLQTIAGYIDTEVSTILGWLDTEITTILGVLNKVDTMLQLDGAVYQFTVNALEQTPSSGSSLTAEDVWTYADREITGGTIATYTGNTPQTGDAFARLGAPVGASISADVAGVKADTGTLTTRITANLFSGITQMSKWLGAIAGKTADASTLTEIQATTAGATFNNTTDSLEAIRDRGDSSWSGGGGGGGLAGSGASTYTPTIRTSGGTPLAGVDVWVSTDSPGDNIVAGTLVTNAFGQVEFALDAGSYYMRVQKVGYNATNPIVITVNETATTATHDVFTAAAAPGTSLAITYSEIRRQLGLHLSWDRDPDNWSADEIADANEIIKQGLRAFYWPMLEGGGTHVWSFLCPLAELDVEADTTSYTLPENFGVMAGDKLTFTGGSNYGYVERIAEDELRALQGNDDLAGTPKYFAVRVRPAGAGEETSYELLLYPKPDKAATLTYRYQIEPSTIDASSTYPLGGSVHAQTVLESCLAAAERILEDTMDGAHYKAFQAQLAASIELDKQASAI